ncbi:hypothetical protein ACEWY4_007223 [Coilia grayii]|uniref:Immunoglobulin domain-containing protein n=1 Tax=Coilia grayii TaxID=363190 RepID=A0ABD1KG52_9TELE
MLHLFFTIVGKFAFNGCYELYCLFSKTSFSYFEQLSFMWLFKPTQLFFAYTGFGVMLHLEAFERKRVSLGDTVEIDCNISFHRDITWLKLNNDQPPIVLMVTALSHGKITAIYQDKHLWSNASVKERTVALAIKNISVNHLGLYYCTTTKDKVLTFGTGVLVYVSGDVISQNVHQVHGTSTNCDNGTVLPSTGAPLRLPRLIYVLVLGCALLTMIGATVVVHLLSSARKRQINKQDMSI